MAAASLIALIDDIATVLDDVAVLTKVAASKTAGVLGDDLALNAEQVAGVQAERELPVVWAVAKGSLVNKAILVPAALLISAFVPWLITPLLMLGGAYLCFEGFEKLAHRWLHPAEEDAAHHQELVQALVDPQVDLVAFERDKIRGAVRTDFVLSAEIITITLGAVAGQPFMTQLGVLVATAVLITVGVYGLVGAIVKMDDVGLYLSRKVGAGGWRALQRQVGVVLLNAAPRLMKLLAVLGTAAMFLVGGGILTHGLPGAHELLQALTERLAPLPAGALLVLLAGPLTDALAGIVAGALTLLLVTAAQRLSGRASPAD
jgi:predicted DNA repair protein MutK